MTRRPTFERVERRILFANLLPGFSDSLAADDLFAPVAMDFAPDGRIFVTEKDGNVRIVKDGQTLPAPFVSPTVNASGERGVLGVALDPNFSQNNYVYVYYTATTPTIHNRVSRFTADGDVAVPGSETVIVDLDPLSDLTNHNGGHIGFGPDGMLYIAQGENGNPQQAQSLDTRFGKILRVQPDGSIPVDNPFFTAAPGANNSIWARGLRNPFTFAFSPTTGEMYINDVGANSFEEINVGAPAANYGWPQQEGLPSLNSLFTNPKFYYGRQPPSQPAGTTISGGAFYAGATQQFPSEYANDYFFADSGAQFIWTLDAETGAAKEFATDVAPIVDLKVGSDGSLYYVSYTGGEIRKISFDASTLTDPTIVTQPANATVGEGEQAIFSVQATGDRLTYQWQRDDVNIEGATSANYSFSPAALSDNGAVFRVVVIGGSGESVTSSGATLTVVAGEAPGVEILSPVARISYKAGQAIKFKGAATDAEDGKLPTSGLSWRVDRMVDGNVVDVAMPEKQGIRSGTFRIPRENVTSDSTYRLFLTATDSTGLTNSTSYDISLQSVQITVTPSQPGLVFGLDGVSTTTPTTFEAVVGSRRTLTAEATQIVDGVTYTLQKLANRKKSELLFTVPAKDREILLTYVPQQAT